VGRGPGLITSGAHAGPPGGGRSLPVDREPGRISAMFAGIAARYDLMNRLMTLGMDGGWRRLAALEALVGDGGRALDACCGTGDLTLELAELWPCATVIGLDFTGAMLEVARRKAAAPRHAGASARVSFVRGDVLALPFSDGEFSAVTVGWGVRNVPDVLRAFAEMARVTRPGGRVVCLESTVAPPGLERVLQDVWMGGVVPRLGRVVSGDPSAYAYLPASVEAFPRVDELAAVMSEAGLTRIRYRRLGFGAVALHVGEVPGGPAGSGAA
jgi:demethylmenaquinone methyltransferase / 2-methoxy-6-polyprenyl-1,4-benzoquinol methylase